MTSPCSVSLRRPSTAPGAPPRMARLVGPAAAPDGAAPTVEDGQLHAVPPRRLDQLDLGLVEHPGRGQEAALLVRVRVAEHDLLAIASAGQVGAIGRVAEQRLEDRAGRVERVGRLEQGHDVEDRRCLAVGRPAGELQDIGHIRRAGRERHDDPVAGADAVAGLDGGDGPERGQHLPEAHTRADLVVGRGVRGQGRQRRLVDAAVLAHLDRGQVEAERPELPAQLGDLAVGDALQAVGREGLLELGQLRVQGGARPRSGRCAARPRRSGPGASGAAARR